MDLNEINSLSNENKHATQAQYVEAFNDDMERLAKTIESKREIMQARIAKGDYTATAEYDLIGKVNVENMLNESNTESQQTSDNQCVYDCDNVPLNDVEKHLSNLEQNNNEDFDNTRQAPDTRQASDMISVEELKEARNYIIEHMNKIYDQIETMISNMNDLTNERKKLKDQLSSIQTLIDNN